MDYFAGLDVPLESVNVCIVSGNGIVVREEKIGSEPEQIFALFNRFGHPLKRIGLEAGPTSSWLFSELRAAGYPALCLECRHVKAGLSAMRNKTDRNDARGIAQLVRLGWFRLVHVKSQEAQQIRMLSRQSNPPPRQAPGYRELGPRVAQGLRAQVSCHGRLAHPNG